MVQVQIFFLNLNIYISNTLEQLKYTDTYITQKLHTNDQIAHNNDTLYNIGISRPPNQQHAILVTAS